MAACSRKALSDMMLFTGHRKMILRSGCNPVEALEKMGDGLLGHKWDPVLDNFTFKLSFHSGKRQKDGVFENEEFSIDNLDCLGEKVGKNRLT